MYFRRTSSLIGLNAQLCSTRLDVPLSELDNINMKYEKMCILCRQSDIMYQRVFFMTFCLSRVSLLMCLSSTDVVCVLGLFVLTILIFFLFCFHLYDFHNK